MIEDHKGPAYKDAFDRIKYDWLSQEGNEDKFDLDYHQFIDKKNVLVHKLRHTLKNNLFT